MSTIKSVYLQHLNGTTPNATMDTNGNFTVGGTVSGASSNMFRNRIINGDMRIDQRNAGASVTASTGNPYTVDRWTAISSQNSKFTIQQNAGSVTPPAGFVNYLGITSSSAYTVGSSEQFLIRQNIEGFNTADLAWGTSNAKTVTLSFWVRSSLTGTFGGALYNNDGSRSYPFTYTISAANTWEYKTITISGDTAGTWQTTTSVGVTVDFGLGVGSTLSGTAGTWASAYYGSATGTTSVVGTSGATWYVTGVQLEVGTTATPFEFRSYGHELALCQRYYEKSYNVDVAPGTVTSAGQVLGIRGNGAFIIQARFMALKRANPSITVYSPTSGTSGKVRNLQSGLDENAGSSAEGHAGINIQGTSATLQESFAAHWVAAIEL